MQRAVLVAALVAASVAGGSPGAALGFREPHVDGTGPRSYTLAASSTLAGGAQVRTTVKASVDLGLAVFVDDTNLTEPVGLVPLGHVNPGTHTVPWDLRVGGHLLAPGRYVVALEIFRRDGRPSGRGFPPPAALTVSPDGRTSAAMTSLPTTTKSETDWTVVVIGVIAALAIGALVGVALGRRRPGAAS
jgi:hypothetical protein